MDQSCRNLQLEEGVLGTFPGMKYLTCAHSDRNGNKTSEPVPAVRDLLDEFGDRTFWNFDIKDLRAIPLIVLMIEELSLKNRTVLSGLSVRQVRKFSARYPEVNMLVNLSRQDKVFPLLTCFSTPVDFV